MSRSSGSESKPFPPQVLSCKLLIDGYNLMYSIGYAQAGDMRPKALESGRNRLIELLAEHLGPAAHQTCIVFDAGDVAPKGLPKFYQQRSIHLLFSSDYLSADECIQEILQVHSKPKQLVLLSSDHRVQRKGTARGATIRDSEEWKQAIELLMERALKDKQPDQEVVDLSRQTPKVSASDLEAWLREFGF
jgi:predicted RNA-binding protein with PIN domain